MERKLMKRKYKKKGKNRENIKFYIEYKISGKISIFIYKILGIFVKEIGYQKSFICR